MSTDGGVTWLDESDLEDRGVIIDTQGDEQLIEHRNCCEFYCADGNGELVDPEGPDVCKSCQSHSECTAIDSSYRCAISACDDRFCEDDDEIDCDSPADCPNFGRCVHACD